MVWVAPVRTAGLASSLLWQTEDEIGGAGGEAARWAFEFQRHRLANAGALAGMRKRLEGGGHAFTHRIVMTDADQTAISYCEGMADAKQSWNFLCDRVVPQMQVHARTYEDPKRVAKGLFEGSYAYLSMQTDAPVTSVPSYAAKCWQVVCDVVPLAPPPGLPNASWIVPAAPGNASSLYWREVETSTFATLERSVLPLDSMGLLWDMWGRKPAAVRMRLRDKLGHVIASGSEDEVATAWRSFKDMVEPALTVQGVRPGDGWKEAASEMLVYFFSASVPSYLARMPPPPPVLASSEDQGAQLQNEGAQRYGELKRRIAFGAYLRALRRCTWGVGGGWLGEEARRMASFLDLSSPAETHGKRNVASQTATSSLPSVVTWWPPLAAPPRWQTLPSVTTWFLRRAEHRSRDDVNADGAGGAMQADGAGAGQVFEGGVRWLGGVMVDVWGQSLGEDDEVVGWGVGGVEEFYTMARVGEGDARIVDDEQGPTGAELSQLLVFGVCSGGRGLDARARHPLITACADLMQCTTAEANKNVSAWEDAIVGSAYLFECVDGARPAGEPSRQDGGGWKLAAAAIGAGALVVATGGVALPALELTLGSALAVGAAGSVGGKAVSEFASIRGRQGRPEEFSLRSIPGMEGARRARGGVLISGWLMDSGKETKEEPAAIWGVAVRALSSASGGCSREWVALRWDVEVQWRLGGCMSNPPGAVKGLISAALGMKNAVGRAVGGLVDDPWHEAGERAEAAGSRLADALIRRDAKLPVTLVGYGHGARAALTCLITLSKSPDGAGIVEDCFLMGCTSYPRPVDWKAARSVVAGKLVNGYCLQDSYLARRPSIPAMQPPAGVAPARAPGVTDIDMTHLKPRGGKTFADYRSKLTECLCKVGFQP